MELRLISLLIILLTYSTEVVSQNSPLKRIKIETLGIKFNSRSSWKIGNPSISTLYWVAMPPFKSVGSEYLKVVLLTIDPKIKGYSSAEFKRDLLSKSLYFKNIDFIHYRNTYNVAGCNALDAYYQAEGVQKGKFFMRLL